MIEDTKIVFVEEITGLLSFIICVVLERMKNYMENLKERVISVVKNAVNVNEEINEKTQLREIGFDSLKNVELVVLLEEEFDLHFDDSKLSQNRFENVQSVIDLVRESIG